MERGVQKHDRLCSLIAFDKELMVLFFLPHFDVDRYALASTVVVFPSLLLILLLKI